MTPFLQFRLWLRRGPGGERILTAVAVVVLVALLAWAAIPVRDDTRGTELAALPGPQEIASARGQLDVAPTVPGQETATPGEEAEVVPGAGLAIATPGAATRPGPTGGAPTATSGATAATRAEQAGDPCGALRATDQGVTATEVFLAVSLINLGGDVGNETFGIRSDLEAVAKAAAAGINAEGGIACRKLRIKTYRVNPLNQNEQRSKCLEIAEDKPFAVIDYAGYLDPVARSCFPQHKLPYQAMTSVTEDEAAGAYPFMYSALASTDRQLRNWVFEAAARRAFDAQNGFRKIGLLLNACNPKVNEELQQNLNKVGVRDDQMSTFTLRCATVAPPSEVSQAMFQHRQDNVSHVLLAVPLGTAQSYVRNADQLSWKPVYMASDFGSVTVATSERGWSDGFDKTIAITSNRGGELNSGIVHPRVGQCQAWMRNAGVPPPEKDADSAIQICDAFRLFAAAGNAAGADIVRTSLLPALAKVGRIDFASYGVGVYDRPGKVTGGDQIRAVQWHRDCRCWKVLDRDMKPAH